MRNVKIKGISISNVEQPLHVVNSAVKPLSMSLLASEDQFAHVKALVLPVEEELASQPMVRVELEVEGALPTTNYANFWLGDQLMLGTMIREGTGKISGYVRRPVEGEVRVRIEFPDGSEKIFDLSAS